MAWPWLSVAVKSIPWAAIVRRTPDIINAASSLLVTRRAAQAAESVVAHTETQLDEIRGRLSDLENHDQETAQVINQIAQQTRDISVGMEVLAAKIRLLTILVGVTLITAVSAMIVAIAR